MKKAPYLSLLVFTLASFVMLAGCATSGPKGTASTSGADGSRLWAQNCVRCHNSRSPTEYSDSQWDVIMLHMRVRAGLAANDARLIREFLRSAN